MNARKQFIMAALAAGSISGAANATQVFRIESDGRLIEVQPHWTLQGTCVTTELPGGNRYLLVIQNVAADQPGFIEGLFDARSDAWTHVHINANQLGLPVTSLREFQRNPQEGGEESASPPGSNAVLASQGGSLSTTIEGSSHLPFTISLHGTRERDRMDFNRDDAVDGADLLLGLEAAAMPQPEVENSPGTTNPCCVVSEMSFSPTMAELQRSNPALKYATPIGLNSEVESATRACPVVVFDLLEAWERYAGQ